MRETTDTGRRHYLTSNRQHRGGAEAVARGAHLARRETPTNGGGIHFAGDPTSLHCGDSPGLRRNLRPPSGGRSGGGGVSCVYPYRAILSRAKSTIQSEVPHDWQGQSNIILGRVILCHSPKRVNNRKRRSELLTSSSKAGGISGFVIYLVTYPWALSLLTALIHTASPPLHSVQAERRRRQGM